MTLEEIRNRIEDIKNEDGDDEAQHGLEDLLHLNFIKYISNLKDCKLAILAEEILLVDKMPFARWCA